jgi:diguanylate cyclase (GGDEF)-like protein
LLQDTSTTLDSAAWIAILSATCTLIYVVGWLSGRAGRRRLDAEVQQLRDELSRTEVQTREQSRQAVRMRSEQRTLDSLLRLLPSVVQQLNNDRLQSRSVPQLILQMTTAIFEPDQILLYLVRIPDKTERTSRHLHLVARRGLPDVAPGLASVTFGEGKIGWVAEQQTEMSTQDWLNPTRIEGVVPPDNDPALRANLLGPLLHFDHRGKADTLGVLCIGGAAVRPRDEKSMLRLITNLGAIALTHAKNVYNLESRAYHDGLTGLLNKQRFMESLGNMIHDAERDIQSVGVFMFDIDHFKQYNDTNGHMAGDELLKRIARVIRENLRPGDLPCRYGGEEFLVAMPDTDGLSAHGVAERIRAAIESEPFPHEESQPLGTLTISGGVAEFPVDGTNSTELVRDADQALYRAKAAGRNRVLRFEGVQIGGPMDDDEGASLFEPSGALEEPGFDHPAGPAWKR